MTEFIPFTIDRIAPRAANYLRRLPRRQQRAVTQAFDYLRNQSPFHHPNPQTIKPLKGKYAGLWRYRVGQIRIIYAVDNDNRAIRIVAIGARGDVY